MDNSDYRSMSDAEWKRQFYSMPFTHDEEITITKREYSEIKEKAGKWDVSQLMTLQVLYGEKAFDLSNARWDEPTGEELVNTVMKALTGAIKNGAVKIKAEGILKKTCYNCTYANHYCDVTGKEEIVERMGHDFVCDSWRNDTITQEEDDG